MIDTERKPLSHLPEEKLLFKGYSIEFIGGEPEEKYLTGDNFTEKQVLIQKFTSGYKLIFFNSMDNIIGKRDLKDETLINLLNKINPQIITDLQIRQQILQKCTEYDSCHFDQRCLLRFFQTLILLVQKHRPNLLEKYQIRPLSEKEMKGFCFGLGVANTLLLSDSESYQHFQGLLQSACSILPAQLEKLVTEEKSSNLYYSLDNFLLTYKKIHNFQSPHEYDKRILLQHQCYSTLNRQWINTQTYADSFTHLPNLLIKLLTPEINFLHVNLHYTNLSGKSCKHAIFICKNEGYYAYYDANINVLRLQSGFKSIVELAQHILRFYQHQFGTDKIIVTANTLSSVVNNLELKEHKQSKFNEQVAILDSIYKSSPESCIYYVIRQYLSEQICQTQFAQIITSELKSTDEKINNDSLGKISVARHYFKNFLHEKSHSIDCLNFREKQLNNNEEYLIDLIEQNNCSAILKLITVFPQLYSKIFRLVLESQNNNLYLITILLKHRSHKQMAEEKLILEGLSVTANGDAAALLLKALGRTIDKNTNIWVEVAYTAIKHNELGLLNGFSTVTLEKCLIRIEGEIQLISEQKQKMREQIERVFFHQLNNQFPLNPTQSNLNLSTPSISEIVGKLSIEEKAKHLPILIQLGHAKRPSPPPLPRGSTGVQSGTDQKFFPLKKPAPPSGKRPTETEKGKNLNPDSTTLH